LTLMRPMVEAGRLVTLFEERLKAEFAHYLVFPERSERHRGLQAFRDWLLQEARDYAGSAECVQARAKGRQAGDRAARPARRAR
jgi:LysR family glycine cleavage system transcriptional activator